MVQINLIKLSKLWKKLVSSYCIKETSVLISQFLKNLSLEKQPVQTLLKLKKTFSFIKSLPGALIMIIVLIILQIRYKQTLKA